MALIRSLVLAATLTVAPPIALFAPSACAQGADSDASSFLVTNANEAAIRSGADLDWYVVAQFERGTVLHMDGEVDGWFRVSYPAGTPAVVKTSDAELHKDRGVVVLTRRSSLLAYNLLNPYMEDCYKRLFADQPLTPGTELTYIGPLENRRGELMGYKVVAPQGAEGYVFPGDVRPATPEEIHALANAKPTPGDPGNADATEVASTPASDARPTSNSSASTRNTVGTSNPDVREIVRPAQGAQPAPMTTQAPAPATFTTPAPSDAPANVSTPAPSEEIVGEEVEVEVDVQEMEMGAPTPAQSRPAPITPRSLSDVDAAYKQVMKQDVETAEFSQLIDEYSAILGSLPPDASADPERQYIQNRIEILQMRADIQGDMRDLASLEFEAANAQVNLDEFVHKIQIARGYLVVGRLSPSIIYDGDRLPRMFRVVSVDAASGGRTLAYVLPNPDLNMVGKLGSLVGVQGEDDPTATRGEVRVIKPTLVEVLTTDAGTPSMPRPQPAPAPTVVTDGNENAGS